MVNFKLRETNAKQWSACHECHWDKEKICVPNRIQTFDLPNTGWALLIHLSYGELMEIRAKPYTGFIFDMRPAYC